MSVDIGKKVVDLFRKTRRDILLVGILSYAIPNGGIMPMEGHKALVEIGCCRQYLGKVIEKNKYDSRNLID